MLFNSRRFERSIVCDFNPKKFKRSYERM